MLDVPGGDAFFDLGNLNAQFTEAKAQGSGPIAIGVLVGLDQQCVGFTLAGHAIGDGVEVPCGQPIRYSSSLVARAEARIATEPFWAP